jgi:ABC-type transport system involved in multi-copper enzyme maturation permease subunit
MKSLFVKEWREHWLLAVFAAILMALMFFGTLAFQRASSGIQPSSWSDFSNTAVSDTAVSELYFVWLLSAALCGSYMVAPEVGNGTLQFLSALPISRKAVWWTKLASALAVHALSMAAAVCAYLASYIIAMQLNVQSYEPFPDKQVISTILAITLPVFAVATVATMLLDRVISALMATVCFSILGFMGVNMVDQLTEWNSGTFNYCAWTLCSLWVLSCLDSSCRIFVRGETLKTPKRYVLIFHNCSIDVVVILASLVVAYYWIVN